MITPFPNDLLAMLDGDWATAKGALKQGLASQNAGQAGYGRFDHDIIVPAGTLTYTSGIWTPVDVSGANLVLVNPTKVSPRYVRLGRMVYVTGAVKYPTTVDGALVDIGGLPFRPSGDASQSGAYEEFSLSVGFSNYGAAITALLTSYDGPPHINLYSIAGVLITNANFSGKSLRFSGWYLAAS